MSHHSQEDQEKILELNKEFEEMKTVLGETGKFPDGQLNKDDEGEIVFAIASTPNGGGRVILHFGKSVAWVGMKPDEARSLATLLEYRADQCEKGVTVELPDGM